MVLEWYPDEPHSDDKERLAAIEEGLVGPGCKMGGPAIRLFAGSGKPCDFCPLRDRTECGGSPLPTDSRQPALDEDPSRGYNQNTMPSALKTERERFRRLLDLAFEEKKED